jgi:hypothetical protein
MSIIYKEYGANQPIFGPDGRLQWGRAAGTNHNQNPRLEGGEDGTPGTPPDGWLGWGPVRGLNVQRALTGTEGGLRFVRYRISGVATEIGAARYNMQSVLAGIPATVGQTAINATLFRTVAGSQDNIPNVQLELREYNGTSVDAGGGLSGSLVPVSAEWTRVIHTRVISGATTTQALMTFRYATTSLTEPVDWTFDIAAPTGAVGANVPLPIFPPVGSPGPSTAGLDVGTAPWVSVLGTGDWTIFGNALVDPSLDAVATPIISGDVDGSNRWRLSRNAGGAMQGLTVLAGTAASAALGNRATNTQIRFAISQQGGGTHFCVDNTVDTISTVIPGLVNLRFGSAVAVAGVLRGSYGRIATLPFGIPPADLAAALASSGV